MREREIAKGYWRYRTAAASQSRAERLEVAGYPDKDYERVAEAARRLHPEDVSLLRAVLAAASGPDDVAMFAVHVVESVYFEHGRKAAEKFMRDVAPTESTYQLLLLNAMLEG